MSYSILLTIDVEDWFQVENFKQYIPFPSWPTREVRVEKNTHRLLDLLDSIELAESSKLKAWNPATSNQKPETSDEQSAITYQLSPISHQLNEPSAISYELKNSPKVTFFILGWIAERLPQLIREIHSRGHEVASHGYLHNLCNQQSHEELKKDLIDSKKLLEDIIGAPVFGYRAPSFAINNDILKIIEDCGYLYDSSYNSFAMNKRYGKVDLPQKNNKGIALQITKTDHANSTKSSIINHQSSILYELPSSSIINHQSSIVFELPVSNINIGNHILPWGGGGYFRLIPFPVFKLGVQSILRKQGAYLLYLHPWELDPEQPRVKDAPAFFKFRHYINLSKTHSKLLRLIRSFQHCHFVTCSQYLSAISHELSAMS